MTTCPHCARCERCDRCERCQRRRPPLWNLPSVLVIVAAIAVLLAALLR